MKEFLEKQIRKPNTILRRARLGFTKLLNNNNSTNYTNIAVIKYCSFWTMIYV